ncbi:MAG: ABC transporter ATP-binding protein [Chloroflexi bacterium]|nr:ABC transporter ATP-binding protein [Chloroflexota bacterium]
MNQHPLLRLTNINTYYGSIHILQDVNIEVFEGEIVCLLGGNASGKSTTLKTILGLVKPVSGAVEFRGEAVHERSTSYRVERGLAVVPENRRIFGAMTVMENLLMGAYLRSDPDGIREDLDRLLVLFPRLKERLKQAGGTLSGGEQQMLAMARALMSRPKLLLMDEPSMGLAPLLVEQNFQIIQEINRQGTTIFVVEQNANMALSIAHRGYVLQTGRIVLADKAENLLNNELMRKAYLGR